MKKKIYYVVILLLTATMLFTFCGCALLFNDGSEDELEGIWGLSSITFSGVYTSNNSFGADFEYYLVIINKDRSVTIKYKMVDQDEVSYSTQYTPTYENDDNTKVDKISITKMPYLSISETSTENTSYSLIEDLVELSFSPKLETLTYKDLHFKMVNSSPRFATTKISFKKMYDSTSSKKIEKAIKKQISEQSDRE